MIKLYNQGAYLINQNQIVFDENEAKLKGNVEEISPEIGKKGTITYSILENHNKSKEKDILKIEFDVIGGHDVNAVSIIQSARAGGLKKLSKPYIITNCHNALCAIGGTINEDDHKFLLSSMQKYGGIFVPPGLAIIHQYMREMWAAPGKMILASDSHTRYGPLGTLSIGEGGGEIVKQLLGEYYEIEKPNVVGVYLKGKLNPGVGPHDVALSLIGKVFENAFVKDSVMEFIGEGVENLQAEYRFGIDTMSTETTCLSTVWITDDKIKKYLKIHGREEEYKEIKPGSIAYYDKLIEIDLSKIKPVIAFPFHPSNVYEIEEVQKNPKEIIGKIQKEGQKLFRQDDIKFDLLSKIKNNKFYVDQGIIGSCAGGLFENISDAVDILTQKTINNTGFNMSVYPASQPIYIELMRNGYLEKLTEKGVIIKPSICGSCFGAGDIPADGEISIRNNTRNFTNREGSMSNEGQLSSVALMDARSIAATAANDGELTAATQMNIKYTKPEYKFEKKIYENRVYNGFNNPKEEVEVKFGPNIKDWPEFEELNDILILKVVSTFDNDVITTDDLLPSDASNLRSNPYMLAEHTLVMKDANYVKNAKLVKKIDEKRQQGIIYDEIKDLIDKCKPSIKEFAKADHKNISIGSVIYAKRIGDGSSREQAASSQKVLGGWANLAEEYTTKRYASNVKNWGMIPLLVEKNKDIQVEDFIILPKIRKEILEEKNKLTAYIVREDIEEINFKLLDSSKEERKIITDGGLLNHYKLKNEKNN